MTDITVPNVGESVSEVTIATWFKKVGDAVKKDEAIVELETDKAAQELVAPEDGIVSEILVSEGENASVGALIARLSAEGASNGTTAPAAQAKTSSVAIVTTPKSVGQSLNIDVPNVGESVSEVTVANWMKKPGDMVAKDEPLVELETDKAAQELVAPEAGILEKVLIGVGEIAKIGDTLAILQTGGSSDTITQNTTAQTLSDTPAASAVTSEVAASSSLSNISGASSLVAMPAAQRIIDEHNLDMTKIRGTGKDGRILKADAEAAIHTAKAAPSAPITSPSSMAVSSASSASASTTPAAAKASRVDHPREERVRMSRIRQTIARRLKDAQNTAAMLTTYNEADMSEIMALRFKHKEAFIKKHGIKLGFMSFFIKACVQALKDVPAVNAEIDGTDIIYKNYYDISVAVGTDKGLVVPVLRDCDALSLGGIEKGLSALAQKARDGALSMADMSGGTFTVSNGGVYGSLMSSPILNPPQSGILGMHKIEKRPVVINDEIVIRPMMYLALSYDHRIVDGKEAVTFLVRVKECLENPERLLLDI